MGQKWSAHLPLLALLLVIPQGSAVVLFFLPSRKSSSPPKQRDPPYFSKHRKPCHFDSGERPACFFPEHRKPCHFDRSCSLLCEQRSGEICFSTSTSAQPAPRLRFWLFAPLLSSRRDLLLRFAFAVALFLPLASASPKSSSSTSSSPDAWLQKLPKNLCFERARL